MPRPKSKIPSGIFNNVPKKPPAKRAPAKRAPAKRAPAKKAPSNNLSDEQIANRMISILGKNAPAKGALLVALKNPSARASFLQILRNYKPKYVPGVMGREEISEEYYTNRAPGSCAFGRLQIGGTCWFQAILNGFILSDASREFMKLRLNQFKQSHEMKKFTNINACPMRGKLPVYFWSYVEHMINAIEKPNSINKAFNKNVQLGKQFAHNTLIRNIGLRNVGQSVEGGSIKDLEKFLTSVYSSELEEYESTSELRRDHKNYITVGKNVIIPDDKTHVLSHAYITMVSSKEGKGHGVCGYFCEQIKNYVIFDSNYVKPIELDWVNDEDALKRYFIDKYANDSSMNEIIIVRLGVYFNKSAPIPRPPWKMFSNENIIKDIFGNAEFVDNFNWSRNQVTQYLKSPKLVNMVLEDYEKFKNKRNSAIVNKFMPIGKLYGMNFTRNKVMQMAKTNATFRAKMNSVIKSHETRQKMNKLLNKSHETRENMNKPKKTSITNRFKSLFIRKNLPKRHQ